ncbi:clavesin-1-like [Pollicipes pollicipes]|uniref:clavesin-1-like n=1 Tax=Pollicipes pollicipes TaxID=41117 RepID=UPI00188494CB|nr:clavesin-1-like [Pollicipes pollicipes]
MGKLELPLTEEADVPRRTLSRCVLERARLDLNEDEQGRERALAELRDFVRRSRQILTCREDANFLLRFLRMKKYKLPDAQAVLMKYLRMRQKEPHYFHRLDICDPAINDLVTRGYMFVLPERDAAGRRVIVSRGSRVDPSRHTPDQVIRTNLMTFETLLEDEENQVRGFTYLFDQKGIGFSHVFMWSPSQVSHMISCCESAMPMRHQQINFIHVHTLIHAVLDFVKGLLNAKLRSRFIVHSNVDKLYDTLPAKNLPKEYGGITPIDDMIGSWKKELLASRPRLLALDQMRVCAEDDESCRAAASLHTSLATLEID